MKAETNSTNYLKISDFPSQLMQMYKLTLFLARQGVILPLLLDQVLDLLRLLLDQVLDLPLLPEQEADLRTQDPEMGQGYHSLEMALNLRTDHQHFRIFSIYPEQTILQ